MHTVGVNRKIAAEPEALRDAIRDVEPFMRAAGFDGVAVDGDAVTITNHVGLLTIELDLRLIDDPDAVLSYEQVNGIFEAMETRYYLEPGPETTTVSAETTYALDASFVGPLLDATVIDRQRRKELNAQFDALESLD
ncbi:MAG: SRPBCC family protein [Halobacteriales archaeon]|jgi:hypothetical protein